MKKYFLATLLTSFCLSVTPITCFAANKQAVATEETVEALVPPPPYDLKPESKVEIATTKKEQKVTLSPTSIEYDVTTFIKPSTLAITDFLGQFVAYDPEYAIFVDKEAHCLRLARKTLKPKEPGIQSVVVSFADDKDFIGEENPIAITIIGVRPGGNSHKKYKRTFKMPDDWGSRIKIEGYDEYLYVAEFNVLHQLMEALIRDPMGDDPSIYRDYYRDFSYEKYQD